MTYFHVVFTLPSELRRLVRSHQKALLPVLFRAAFESLSALAADPHYLGARIGALAVLHTWTRTLDWHPHLHMLVPAGGLAPDGLTWRKVPRRKSKAPFLVPVKALGKGFAGRFLDFARRALPKVRIPDIPDDTGWVVFAKAAVQGADKVLEYLGRYVHKTALSDGSILACDDKTVTFRYRDSRDFQLKTMTFRGQEFLRRFLQHVPPRGFHRVRAFGLLHPAHRDTLRRLQLLLPPPAPPPSQPVRRPRLRCPHCKQGELVLLGAVSPATCVALAAQRHPWTTGPARAPPHADGMST